MASTTTYESFGSVYGNTKEKMTVIESALKLGGLDVAYNDEQSGTIIMAVVTETDGNNLIDGTPAPEVVSIEPEVADTTEKTDE